MKLKLMAACCIFITGAAFAQCQVSLSSPNVDYGNMRSDDVINKQNQWSELNERTIQMNAVCDSAEKMAVFINGTSIDKGFRFSGNSVMSIEASGATLDGKPVHLGLTETHAPFIVSEVQSDKVLLVNNRGLIPLDGAAPGYGQQFSVTLTLRPQVNVKDTFVRDKTTLESDITFKVETE